MHRVTLVLCVLVLTTSARAARAGDEAAPPAAVSPTALAALPPLAPIEREAVGAADASGGGTILMSALYGGLAGAVIGVGIGLLENGNYGRDIAIGAGAGILIGGALGAAHAFGDSRGVAATDGLNSTERYPVLTARAVTLGGRF